jgi:hypothetical protein
LSQEGPGKPGPKGRGSKKKAYAALRICCGLGHHTAHTTEACTYNNTKNIRRNTQRSPCRLHPRTFSLFCAFLFVFYLILILSFRSRRLSIEHRPSPVVPGSVSSSRWCWKDIRTRRQSSGRVSRPRPRLSNSFVRSLPDPSRTRTTALHTTRRARIHDRCWPAAADEKRKKDERHAHSTRPVHRQFPDSTPCLRYLHWKTAAGPSHVRCPGFDVLSRHHARYLEVFCTGFPKIITCGWLCSSFASKPLTPSLCGGSCWTWIRSSTPPSAAAVPIFSQLW